MSHAVPRGEEFTTVSAQVLAHRFFVSVTLYVHRGIQERKVLEFLYDVSCYLRVEAGFVLPL